MRIYLLIIIIFVPQFLSAQIFRKRIELGASLGTTHYLGDINGTPFIKTDLGALSDVQYNKFGICTGATLRYQFTRVLAIRTSLNFAQAKGDDANSWKLGNQARNLSFKTNIYDLAATFEFPIIFQSSAVSRYVRSRRGRNEGRFYGFIGLGMIYFNPTATFKGAVYDLQPLGTEGVNYTQLSLTIPAGLGYSYSWKKKYKIAMEFGFRKTFTDYIDDVHDTYISKEELLANNPVDGEIAYELAYRSKGNEFDSDFKAAAGLKRGNVKTDDYLIYTTIQFYYTIKTKRRSHRAKF